MLNIQRIIEQHYPALLRGPRLLGQPAKALLRMLGHEREMQEFARRYPQCTGLNFVDDLLEFFSFSFAVRHNEKERIPARGRVVIIANHPIGTLDAMALLKLVGEVRSDVKVLGSSLLSDIDALGSVVLPFSGKRGEPEQLALIKAHLEEEGALIVFPAGAVSRFGATGIRDDRWRSAFLTIAEAAHAPILPMHIDARNSLFFYSLSLVSKPLSTLWLVRETFRHTDNSVVVRIGELIAPDSHEDSHLPLKTKVKLFRKQVYRLPKDKPSLFRTIAPIAHPEDRMVLKREIEACECLGETRDAKQIYLFKYVSGSSVMREIGRLREESFRLVGEGTGNRRDIDQFDQHYLHIVLWDANDLEIVGAYRLCPSDLALQKGKEKQLYTETLFTYGPGSKQMLRAGLELGRSFVQPRYWGSRSLDYLWFGIAAFLNRHPQYRYLLGAVSISNSFSRAAKDLLVGYYTRYYAASKSMVLCRRPYTLDPLAQQRIERMFDGLNAKEAFVVLKEQLGHLGYSVPTLYKQYTELCNPGGALFHGFNIDPDFNDCVDGLVVVDIDQLAPYKRKR
ncbi:MAG: lysophospholipid acyltransferase family protein, partial [Oleiphilaceae bacterium]|nr:lysophospholipid acyltransferase family protein [Oleiphilaceae bacterium]